MRKTYRYRNLSFAITDEEEAKFTVEFISDGNEGQTVINIPGDKDPEIDDEGTVSLGKGKDLRSDTTISFSDMSNALPEEDEIRIRYKINNRTIKEHVNKKSVEDKPIIILFIKFPKS
ncbi:MAG: hypothetical protein K8R31_02750 [Bacteroidales bacterium]|nr:hypothetical protein [Bacteroidales bacterium]